MANSILSNCKIVVLDDDPTGIQTVHGCLLITDWQDEYVREAFLHEQPFFYILTNTRAMTREEAAMMTRSAMEAVVRVNRKFGYRLIIVSRSDSCLRGHFPLETDVMQDVLTTNGYRIRKPLPFCPAFIEAGRVTINGIHYMKEGDRLIPVSETEFARDNVFSYHTSILKDYITEKGAYTDDYQIVDAQSYNELYAFTQALTTELETAPKETAVVIRSSSSLPKALSGICDIPLLDNSMLIQQKGVGCFVVGSHVAKSTRQLQQLLETEGTTGIEVDVQCLLDTPEQLMEELLTKIWQEANNGKTPVIFTSRKEIRLDDADRRQHLGQQVSDFLVDIVRKLPYTPTYLVGKGGITSNDIMTKGLAVKTATVMGQIIPSVPCIMTRQFPYIIFPGNVGGDSSLKEVYLKLKS